MNYEKGFSHNYDGKYIKFLEKKGKDDKGLHNAIVESGSRFNVSIGINSFAYLSSKNEIDSIKKLHLVFNLVLCQIEIETNANKL